MYKLLIYLAAFYLIEGCLITNCPKGGKRSIHEVGFHRFRFRNTETKNGANCQRCGPNHEGRCVGPAICCGPKIGCLMGTPTILSQCSELTPELPRSAKACSIGVCLSDGVCCSLDASE